ncbi:hypothetical protein ACHAXR_007509 [Thalassiosira sp. AJA248-18]
MVVLIEECNGHDYGSIAQTESSPLCSNNGTTVANGGEALSYTPTIPFLKDKELLQDEIAGMTKLAIPVIVTYILEMLPGVVTIILVGRAVEYDDDNDDEGLTTSMQKLHLDAAALAVMFTNVVALSPAFGKVNWFDIFECCLMIQAHGANQPSKMGTYSLTGITVISLVCLTSSIIIWNTSSILIALGQPIEVSHKTGEFIRWMLPGVPFLYMYEIIRKVFESRNVAMPLVKAAVVCNVVNIGVGYYLVHCTNWGWMGAAVARSTGNVVMIPTALIGMVMRSDGSENAGQECSSDISQGPDGSNYLETDKRVDEDESSENESGFLHHLWEGFVVSEALNAKAIIEFLSLGLPGMLQLMFEWCAYEVIALLCGILPGQQAIVGIGANVIIMNVSYLTYMFYYGCADAGKVRIGNALGAGDAHRAEIASNLTLISGAIMGIINIVFLLAFRKVIPWFFTTDLDIALEAQRLFLIAAAFQLPDAINACLQEIFRGTGRQALGAKVNFVAFYIIGIPLGYILGVKRGFGVEGLWWGMTAGLCSICIACTFIVRRTNWNNMVLEATTRLNR